MTTVTKTVAISSVEDIVTEMFQAGELQEMVGAAK